MASEVQRTVTDLKVPLTGVVLFLYLGLTLAMAAPSSQTASVD